MSVHQCPICPLRFSFRTELEFHLREDHDREPQTGDSGPAGEQVGLQPLARSNDGRADQLVAATACVSAVSTRLHVSPSPADLASSLWPDFEPASDTLEGNASGRIDGPLRPVSLMPRWVVVTVIALVVVVLGLGLLFGS